MSTKRTTVARSLHDLGLAVWFGGSLMGAVGVNRSAAAAARSRDTTQVAGAGWAAWTPVNLVAIGAYLVGGAQLTFANSGRVAAQRGVGSAAAIKAALTAAALGATGYSRLIGQRVMDADDTPAEDGTTPADATRPEIASAQRQLDALQWVIPASTGALVVLSALMGEQQRTSQVAKGVLGRVTDHLPVPGADRSTSSTPAAAALSAVLEHSPFAG